MEIGRIKISIRTEGMETKKERKTRSGKTEKKERRKIKKRGKKRNVKKKRNAGSEFFCVDDPFH